MAQWSHCKQVEVWARTVPVGGQAWCKLEGFPLQGLKLRRCKSLTVTSGRRDQRTQKRHAKIEFWVSSKGRNADLYKQPGPVV